MSSASGHGLGSMLLAVSAAASAGCAASAFLPWYGVGGWRSFGAVGADEVSALSLSGGRDAPLFPLGDRPMGVALVVLGAVACILILVRLLSEASPIRWLSSTAGVAVAALLALAIAEALATPPFGDEPALRATWGAALGVASASAALLGLALASLAGRPNRRLPGADARLGPGRPAAS